MEYHRLPEVLRRYPVSRSKLYEEVARGRFPKPVKFGRVALWRDADLRQFDAELAAQVEAAAQ